MFIEILFKMLLFKGGVLIYAEHCIYIYIYIYIYIRDLHPLTLSWNVFMSESDRQMSNWFYPLFNYLHVVKYFPYLR